VVKDRDLFERLKALGFPLFETRAEENANLTLADVVMSHDLRLWEGFPVLLANSAMRNLFENDKVARYLKKPFDRSSYGSLVAMSLALYKALGMKFSWADTLGDSLSAARKKESDVFFEALKKGSGLKLGKHEMSSQRLKTVFNNYFAQDASRLGDLLAEKKEFGLEYALSQVFSPKQKDLFLKKLKGEKLTKTEKEYFSRTVKKKAVALANPELHQLARRLLE
jgi:hypothetical protein